MTVEPLDATPMTAPQYGRWKLLKWLRFRFPLSAVELGTFPWAAPEQLLGQRCSVKADIYAYGGWREMELTRDLARERACRRGTLLIFGTTSTQAAP